MRRRGGKGQVILPPGKDRRGKEKRKGGASSEPAREKGKKLSRRKAGKKGREEEWPIPIQRRGRDQPRKGGKGHKKSFVRIDTEEKKRWRQLQKEAMGKKEEGIFWLPQAKKVGLSTIKEKPRKGGAWPGLARTKERDKAPERKKKTEGKRTSFDRLCWRQEKGCLSRGKGRVEKGEDRKKGKATPALPPTLCVDDDQERILVP